MITLALAQMVFFFCLQAPFTGGEDGIQSVPRGKLLGMVDLTDNTAMYYFVLAIFAAGFLLIYRIIHSPFGQVLKAIRENEPRAISLGYRTERYKLLAFVLSAALAGLAGATKAIVFQLASLTDVHWSMSGEVVLMTLLGGMGTVFGPVAGAFVIAAMENYLVRARRVGHDRAGHHLRGLRARLPPRHRGRARGLAAAAAASSASCVRGQRNRPPSNGLERNAANYAPLTPVAFLARAAEVYPGKPAVIHGERALHLSRVRRARARAWPRCSRRAASGAATPSRSWRPTCRRCSRRTTRCRGWARC